MSRWGIGWGALRLFRNAVHVWVLVFIFTSLPAMTTLWQLPVSPTLPPASLLSSVTQAFSTWAAGHVPVGIAMLLVCCLYQLLRPSKWYVSFLVWMLYTGLMHQAWLAGSGGQQLMSNMLFWLIFIPDRSTNSYGWIPATAFWILRLQLLLAYAVTAIHKLTGTLWLDGTAVGVVASDPSYGPVWLAHQPLLAAVITWCALLFQLTFPLAVWWYRTRPPWMLAGILFHAGPAIWLEVPEMALAFIACYPLWLDEREVEWLAHRWRRMRGAAADGAR